MWYAYTIEYYSAIKRMKSCHLQQMGVPRGYYSKWNKSDRERQILYDFTFMWKIKNETKEQTKQKQTHRYREKTSGCQGEGLGGKEK